MYTFCGIAEERLLHKDRTAARSADVSGLTSLGDVTTQAVAPRERLDYWRSLFSACHIDRPQDWNPDDFRGRMSGGMRRDGVRFAHIRSDPLVCSFGRRDSDLLLLGYVGDGRVGLRQGDQTAISDHAMVLVDCDRPAISEATRYDLTYLELPRSLVVSVMGPDPVARGSFVRPLPHSGLAPLLRGHLAAMGNAWSHLETAEAAAALDSAASLAVSLLAGLNRNFLEDGQLDDAVLAAARRYIQAHAHRPGLTAEDIASAVGCSRAHLYRLFVQNGKTIGGELRETRLTRAKRAIETQLDEPIGAIAFACGYSDLSAFGKAFRRRFEMTPRDCRALALHHRTFGDTRPA